MKPIDRIKFAVAKTSAELPYRAVPDWKETESYKDDPSILGVRSRKLIAHPECLKPHETLNLVYIGIGAGLSFLAMNGEIVGEYGRHIKAATKGAVIPLGYSNGHTTYIPTALQLEQGGYEGNDVFFPPRKAVAF